MSDDKPIVNKPAFIRMFVVGISAGLVMSLSYINPLPHIFDLSPYQPWVAGDAEAGLPADRLPFSQWFGGEAAADIPSPSFAGYSNLNDEETTLESNDTAPEEDEREEEALPPPPVEVKKTLVVTPPVTVESDVPKEKIIVIDPQEYAGLLVDISDPSGQGMRHFYESLRRTALKDPGAVTRISHWGASVLGADGLTSTARRKLQALFGSAGRGWVNAARGSQWYHQKDVVYKESGWTSKPVARGQLTPGLYGYGGVAGFGVGWKGSKASYRVYADKMELYYRAKKKGGNIAIRVDDQEPIIVDTDTDSPEDRFVSIQAEGEGEHTFQIKAAGKKMNHVYGVTLETDGPGVVYDCIAMIGTRSSRLLNYDDEHLKGQIAHRKPDLMVLMYGGNEASDVGMNMATYKEKYRTVIQTMRAGRPEASCLIMSPTDHRERYRGRHITSRLLKKIMTVQRELATELGCAYFDMWSAMGGEGSITTWRKNRWTSGDYVHMTKAGNRVLGAIVYKALVKGFADFVGRKKTATPNKPNNPEPNSENETKTPNKPNNPEPNSENETNSADSPPSTVGSKSAPEVPNLPVNP